MPGGYQKFLIKIHSMYTCENTLQSNNRLFFPSLMFSSFEFSVKLNFLVEKFDVDDFKYILNVEKQFFLLKNSILPAKFYYAKK